jgi:hypothetical protein
MKKYLKYVIILTLTAFVVACTEEHTLVVEPSDFNVTTSGTTFKVDERVNFSIIGDPDMILFYSGEQGFNYDNRARVQQAGTPKLSFQVQMQQGTLGNGDTMQLLIAQNLKNFDSTSILSATWTDITNRNTKWPKTLSTTFAASDSIDLSAYNTAETVSLAFKVIGKNNATSAQRKWAIQNFGLNNILSDGSATPIASTFAAAGWIQLSAKNFQRTWDVGTVDNSSFNAAKNISGITIRSAYPITFDPSTAINTDENEDWLITSPINIKQAKPDAAIVVKNPSATSPSVYTYVFRKAGTYTVTFVGQNVKANDKKEIIKQMQITVQ